MQVSDTNAGLAGGRGGGGGAGVMVDKAASSFCLRPCIDLRHGRVTQIVGSTLRATGDDEDEAVTNFSTDTSPEHYAKLYASLGLQGGHVIKLGAGNEDAALAALRAFGGGLQLGGGVNVDNARDYLEAGASHVIVTSFVFKDGRVHVDRLRALVECVGRRRLVLDLSCRRKAEDGKYYVVTDRWQKFTETVVEEETLVWLSEFCDEFLVHGVDVEGKRQGVEEALVRILAKSPIPVTYAGGIATLEDVDRIFELGEGRVHVTIGSALDIFGGDLALEEVVKHIAKLRESKQ